MTLRVSKAHRANQLGKRLEIIRQLTTVRLTTDEIAENPAEIFMPRKREE
jgi:hypothetical protein